MNEWWLVYLAIGAAVGFLAGLLGIGGGAIMVPLLAWAYAAQGMPAERIVHLALGTSMATIFFTSASSMRAHHRQGAVDWKIARAIAPGILVGAFGAALVAGALPTRPLAMIFTVLVFGAATQIFFDLKPKTARGLPGTAGIFGAGAAIGGASSLFAAGGAFLTIPFLMWCNVPVRRAIGTAAAVGFPIAIAGSAGYVLQGYIHWPALALIVATSMAMAPLGARTGYRLPVKRLRMIFAVLMYAMASRMLASLW